jgi:hypothetical protein
MPRPALKDGLSPQSDNTVELATASQQARLLSFDVNDPVFMAQLKRDMEAMRNDPEEIEITKFIEAVAAWPSDDE